MDQSSSTRPSGIPRPAPASRLPVLRQSASQSQLRATPSTEQLRKKPSLASISRPTASTLQKKTSRASLVLPNGLPPPAAAAAPSIAAPPSFRSASRASSRASSRAAHHESDAEHEAAVSDGSDQQRPSLSERTIESLSQLPSSPAPKKGRRRSSFFNSDNSMPPPLRPASATSNGSRPSTSDGSQQTIPGTPKRLAVPPTNRMSMTSPGKRSASANVISSAVTPTRQTSLVRSATRASLGNMFAQSTSPPGTAVSSPVTSHETPVKKTPDTVRRVASSSAALRDHIAKAKAAKKPDIAPAPVEASPKAASSSNALREQIAKAREAAKRARAEPVRNTEIATFDFGLNEDPFNQRAKGGASVLRRRIDTARGDGRLNIAAMGLKEIPDDVLSMYTYDPDDTKVAWGEVVDLTSILAADNELEIIPDSMFPDVTVEDMIDSDEAGPQFGGVQNIDLHGNMLQELPMGLRRLTQLSKLNLSRNKLSMEVFDIIAQIPTLRELKLAENNLEGPLSPALCDLTALEILELQANKLDSLPSGFERLTQLRTLNVTDNQLRSIPSEVFSSALIELHASKNRLEGAFFSRNSVTHLQELHVAQNSLTSLCEDDSIDLPALKVLNISINRFTSLPAVSGWSNLITLLVGENKLTALPEGFTALQQLRTADFTGNDITQLDEKIALMESLDHLTVAANPLRDRKFLSMGTDDLKRDLASRLPADDLPAEGDEEFVNGDAQEPQSKWELTPSGTLDLAGKDMDELEVDDATSEVLVNGLRQLQLQRNKFIAIPPVVGTFQHLTVLDLSRNAIGVALSAPLELAQLRDLRLASNKLTSLTPLTAHLTAPHLVTLDVSINRLSGALPTLHTSFPSLTTLLASDNKISEVSAESLTNLRIVNLGNNDIDRLEPRIGLLQGTLTGFEVEGNKFRVPNRQVLQKGTDAVLTWLRDKIPRESWKSTDSAGTEFFDADDGGF
ncbi:hypothetical protein COCC4DRAFT_207394 [Bipolaris maydis ATCC 48331]|uniref:L domain-like protein n=2 Tax=Cochliobolus heterostrophus TaxID=5016 RepID=M2U6T6_COCH5|nr:uncharacterized protein COCC4DRAFT_207394 [Bipolaris maydis ATCC 48331]EMD89446.1 hypothetical protein COCHEDRAFT_1141685 [Bipolaris maydis C5]ENH99701.1 hypothetical protein COCC4DRAFT_207394 [Bipolaris maydis ATCC 48331]KAJ6212793.1 hypothetical protein PSV09DRAFT_1141685 [Bipolaris maydis]